MTRSQALTLTLFPILAACDDLPPARPTTVKVVNKGTHAIYVTADRLPFRLIDGTNKTWRPDAARAPLCFDCDDVCNSDTHCDPAPVWIKIGAGETVPFEWEGRLYDLRDKACSCGASCFEPEELPDGSYQLVLEYEPELPTAREPYIPFEYDGVTWWCGSGLGYSIPTQERRYPITVAGQPLTVVFTN